MSELDYKINIKQNHDMVLNSVSITREKPSLLLHSCCGPCSTAVIERLAEDYNITVYFYNPNITDAKEYIKRRDSQLLVIDEYNKEHKHENKVSFLEGTYDTRAFYKIIEGLENEPEGGGRCKKCYLLRLEQTAIMASMNNYDSFATTLTISPHKSFEIIGEIGNKVSMEYGVNFLNENFKKKAGFQRSIELSKKYNLYRQNFCGCEFSVWEK
ncbi:MAG: epoxyqueuosine reductase QueH [Anaerovoracaceae bacterium]